MTKPRRRAATPHPQPTLRWYPTGNTRPISTDAAPASTVREAAVAADGGGVADAVNVQSVPGQVESCPCPLDGGDGPDEDDDRKMPILRLASPNCRTATAL